MGYHFTPIKMAFITIGKGTSLGKEVERRKPLCTAGGNVKWYSCYGKHYCGS